MQWFMSQRRHCWFSEAKSNIANNREHCSIWVNVKLDKLHFPLYISFSIPWKKKKMCSSSMVTLTSKPSSIMKLWLFKNDSVKSLNCFATGALFHSHFLCVSYKHIHWLYLSITAYIQIPQSQKVEENFCIVLQQENCYRPISKCKAVHTNTDAAYLQI